MSAAANRARVARGENGEGCQLRPEPRPPGWDRITLRQPPRRPRFVQRIGPTDARVEAAAERYAKTLGLSLSELRERSNDPRLVNARVLVTVALRANVGASYPQAGRALGRHHSSLLVALQRRGLA